LIADPARRHEFTALNSYLFGFQCFLLFSGFFFTILEGAVRELFGVEVKEVLGIENFDLGDTVRKALYAVLALVFLSALLMPMIGLSRWALRVFRRRSIGLRIGTCAALVTYSITVLVFSAYTASAPVVLKRVAGPKAQRVRIHFLADPVVQLASEDASGRPTFRFDYDVAVENVPTAPIIASKRQVNAGFVLEAKGKPDEFLPSNDLTIIVEGRETGAILVEKSGLRAYRLTGTITPWSAAWALMKRKAERPLESNDFGFFVNIRISHDGVVTDRRQWLDVSKLVPARRN
jgi:hypothetical protein